MPDTKRGRERQGRKKREQLETRLAQREVATRDEEGDLPEYPPEDLDSEFVDPEAADTDYN
jgi:hypothetical protein